MKTMRSEYIREWRLWYAFMWKCAHSAKYYETAEVCAEWQDFEAWLDSVGPCPQPGWVFARINTLGNYEPSNCRWMSRQEQWQHQQRHPRDPRWRYHLGVDNTRA